MNPLNTTHEALRPTERGLVMDLVREAGLDVSDWANYANGKKPAAANPRYCYEWAFVQVPDVVVLNIWHHEIYCEADELRLRGNMRDIVSFETSSRNSGRRGRAQRFDDALKMAWRQNLPVRVIICAGERRTPSNVAAASRVKARALDPAIWTVRSYELASGDFILVRGPTRPHSVDQFDIAEFADAGHERRSLTRDIFVRSPHVRRAVLDLADGRCEWCKQPGFALPDGAVYLETHHIVPLSERGPDTVSNVVALCATHHREAHFGVRREKMFAQLRSIARSRGLLDGYD